MKRTRSLRLGAACLAGFAMACGQPSTSSSSHWLECVEDDDCNNLPMAATCGNDGFCVAESGRKVERVVAFADEFDAPTLDTQSFAYETGFSVRNGDAEYYTDRVENVAVQGGELVLTARAEDYEGAAYTSGSITTQGLRSWTYGRVEARILAPDAPGVGPAFWMMPE